MTENPLHDLTPVPASVHAREGEVSLDDGFRYRIQGERSSVVDDAVRRFVQGLRTHAALEFKVAPTEDKEADVTLLVECASAGGGAPCLHDAESYVLEIDHRGILLEASEPAGVLRGLATLGQLIEERRGGLRVPCGSIVDEPRFPWRGLLLDVSRHFIPVAVLKRNLDAMAAVKLNVLHWHLTDDHGFRVECKTFPQLHKRGGDPDYYTLDEIRDVVRYAADRGIRVVPEFGMPGHASGWLVAYPELGCRDDDGKPYELAREWGVHDPCLDPANEKVYEFLGQFFAEILPLFPDEFVHIGGDEVTGVEWGASGDVQEFMREQGIGDTRGLQAHFIGRVKQLLAGHDKKLVGWDEIAHPDIGSDVVVQCWREADSLSELVGEGYRALQSHGFYLDKLEPAATHYSVELPDDPRVLGGEACMWTEYVDADNLDSRLWPRAAAIAERLWSQADVRDEDDLYRRLRTVSDQLRGLGTTHVDHYRNRLDKLAAGRSVKSLQILTDVLAPTGAADRETHRRSRLDRLVDAVPPESLLARRFVAAVDGFLAGPTANTNARRRVQQLLDVWMDNGRDFDREFGATKIGEPLVPVANALAAYSDYARAAVDCLAQGTEPPGDWVDGARSCIAEQPPCHGTLELQVVAPLRRLIEAATKIEV